MGIELTFPFLGSVFIYWLLRRLDRNNINLKKFRSILERGEKQLNDIVLKKSEQLKDSTTEFDILQINTQKYLENLKTEMNKTNYLMLELENNRKQFLETKKDLFDTSQNVISVQNQIHSISEFLETLDSQQKKIKKLEKRIHTVDSEGAQIIKTFQQSIAEASQQNMASIENKVEEVIQKASHYQEEIKKEILSRQETLSEEILQEYDSLKESLRKSGQGLSSDIEARFHKSQNLSNAIQSRLEALDLKINDSMPAMVQELADKLHLNFSEHDTRLGSFKDELLLAEDEFARNSQILRDEISRHKKEIFQDFLKESDALRDQIHQLDLDTIAKKDEIIHATRKEVGKIKENIDQFNELYLRSKDEISSLVSQQAERINQDMAQLQGLHTQVNEEYKGFIDEKKEETNHYLKQVLLEYTTAIDERINSSKKTHDKIFDNTKSLSDEIDDLLRNKQNEWDESFEKSLQEKLDFFAKEIESFLQATDSKEKLFQKMIEASKSKVETISNELDESFRDKFELLDREIQSGEVSIKKISETYEANLQDKLETFLRETGSKEGLMQQFMESSRNKIDSLVEETGNQFQEELKQARKEYSEMYKRMQFLAKDIEHLASSASKELTFMKEESFKENLDNFTKTCQIKVDDLNILASDWKSQLEGISVTAKEEIEDMKVDLKTEKVNIIGDCQKELASLLDESKRAFELKAHNLQEKIENEFREMIEIREDIQNKQANLVGHLKEERRKIENELKSRSYEQLELFDKEMDVKARQFEQTIKGFVDNTLRELNTNSEDVKKEFLNLKELSLKELRKFQQKYEGDIINLHNGIERTDEQLASLQKALGNLKSESNIIKVTEEKIENIKEMIADVNFKLTQIGEKEKAIDQLYNRVDELNSFKVQLDTEILMLAEKREKVDLIEEKLTSLVVTRDQIEEKLNQMQGIKILQDQILENHKTYEIQKNVLEGSLEELLNQKKLVESTVQTVQNQDKSVDDLSQQVSQIDLLLKKLDTKSENLRAQMENLSDQMLSVNKNEAEIETINQRFMQIEDLLEDIDKRKDQIEIIRKKYENLRTSVNLSVKQIEKIETSAEEKVKKLSEFLNALGGDSTDFSPTDLAQIDKKDVILKLSQMGWAESEIAEKINVDMSTVQTLLSTQPN